MKAKNRVVKGKLPTKTSCINWSGDKFLEFIKFGDFWIEDGKFVVNNEKRLFAESRAKDEDYWDEFMTMIDMPVKASDNTIKKFNMRLMAFFRIPLSWLKENPYAISEEMLEMMKDNPRLNWALTQFKEVETESGARLVLMDKDERTNPGIKNVQPQTTNIKNPDVLYQEGLYNMISLFKSLTAGVSKDDLKDMTIKDRMNLIVKMMPAIAKSVKNPSTNKVVFNQLNVNTAKREALEEAILDFNNKE